MALLGCYLFWLDLDLWQIESCFRVLSLYCLLACSVDSDGLHEDEVRGNWAQ